MNFTLLNILKMYNTYMITEDRGLMPHAFGPPGTGKTSTVEQLAKMMGVNLHVINVARLSPLEVGGIQMPINNNEDLKFLVATFWTQIKEGDIVLFDEFLRGFPEVYNALLDIFTSRTVEGYKIPKSFWIAASNSIATYDSALEDRLLHLPVVDARKSSKERKRIAQSITTATGMSPTMIDAITMKELIAAEILPTYAVLDDLKSGRQVSSQQSGSSARNLISQVNLRAVKSKALRDLLRANLTDAELRNVPGDAIYWDRVPDDGTIEALAKSKRVLSTQVKNIEIHLSMLEIQRAMGGTIQEEEGDEDDIFA
jgi:MoxR-like ATPase